MPSTIYAQFADDSLQVIIGIVGGPQDPDVWPNVEAIPSDDPRYVDYYDAQPSMVKQYMVVPGE